MNLELVTLHRQDEKFQDYLRGTFSQEKRAIPISSLNAHQKTEQVTFKIVSKSEIVPPFLGWHWLQILKIRNLLMVAFPLFLILVTALSAGASLDLRIGTLAALGSFALMIAVNLQNDFLDHLSGLDRLHPDSRIRVIQKGWVTAEQMKRWSYFYAILGFGLGLPAIIKYPDIWWIVGGVLVFGIFGLTSYRMGLRYRLWSEFSVFFLLGPVLTLGLHFSFGGIWSFQILSFGVYSGLLSLFYLHIKNFEQIMVNDQARFLNTISFLGFEKSKWMLAAYWGILLLGLMAFYLQGAELWSLVSQVFFAVYFTQKFYRKLFTLRSPIGSQISEACFAAKLGILTLMAIWSFDLLIQALRTLKVLM